MIDFFVPGIPKPAGSKRGFVLQRPGQKPRAIITEDCKTSKDWRADVKQYAKQQMPVNGGWLMGPLQLSIQFFFPRPKSHYWTGKRAGILRDDAPHFHTIKPDTTKLIRGLEDALTGIVWKDDSSVAMQYASKIYGDEPGARVVIECIGASRTQTDLVKP